MISRNIRTRLSKSFKKVKVYVRRRLRLAIDGPIDDSYNTLLHLAVRKGDEKEVLELLQRGATVNIINNDNETPLHLAVQYGHPNVIDYLIERGADTEAEKDDGSTPMHMIRQSPKKIECLERLLKHSADINARDVTGNNLLHLTIKSDLQNMKLIKHLLQNGSNVNNLDFLKNNCLHTIAMNISIKNYETKVVTEALIAEGINLNLRNILAESPLHKAVCGDNAHLVRVLVRNGARLDVLNDQNLNPFDLAVENMSMRSLHVMMKHILLKKHRGKHVEEAIIHRIQSNRALTSLYQMLESDLKSLKMRKITIFSRRSYYDLLCAEEYDVIDMVSKEDTLYLLRNISLVSSKFYWEIIDAWNGARRKIVKPNTIQFETKEEYLLSL